MITVKKDAIRYKDSDGNMKNGSVLCNVGVVGEDLLDHATSFGYLFYKKTFPSDYTLELNIKTNEVSEVSQFFNRTFASTVLGKIVVKGNVTTPFPFTHTFQGTKASEIDLSDFKCTITSMLSTFTYSNDLETIKGELDLSECTNLNSTFSYAYKLKDVSFKPNTIPLNISFIHSNRLSDASIQSIIDGLATVETAQTLTLHADVKAKLTEEQIATITSKNWTLA